MFGAEEADGSRLLSIADCQVGGSTLTLGTGWGIIECSNYNGSGTFQGYINKIGDISSIMLAKPETEPMALRLRGKLARR